MNTALLAKLIEAGTPADLIAEVAAELGRAEAIEKALAQRKENERENSRRYRSRLGKEIPGYVRHQVFERDGFACVDCGSVERLECDHVTPLMAGGSNEIENLQTLCKPCNARKRDRIRKADKRGQNGTNSDEAGNAGQSCEFREKGSLEVSPHTPLPKPSKSPPLNPPIFEEKKEALGSCLRKAYPIDRPDWLPDSFDEFRAMRKRMRNVPFEPGAERRCIAKLERLRAEGHDPEKLLSKAIENGHRTFFPDDTTRAAKGASGKPEPTAQELREKAEWYLRHGLPDDAENCRRRAIQLEQRAAA